MTWQIPRQIQPPVVHWNAFRVNEYCWPPTSTNDPNTPVYWWFIIINAEPFRLNSFYPKQFSPTWTRKFDRKPEENSIRPMARCGVCLISYIWNFSLNTDEGLFNSFKYIHAPLNGALVLFVMNRCCVTFSTNKRRNTLRSRYYFSYGENFSTSVAMFGKETRLYLYSKVLWKNRKSLWNFIVL